MKKIILWLSLGGLTLLLLAGAGFSVWATGRCPNPWFGLGSPLEGFVDRYLSCRTPNELGDFLAGVFAPIAFIWLAGAVVLQSLELNAQQKELKQTSATLEEQKEFIKIQTELLVAEGVRRTQELKDAEYAEVSRTLNRQIWNSPPTSQISFGAEAIDVFKKRQNEILEGFKSRDQTARMIYEYNDCVKIYWQTRSKDTLIVCKPDIHFNTLRQGFKQIISLFPQLSDEARANLDNSSMAEMAELFMETMSKIDAHNESVNEAAPESDQL